MFEPLFASIVFEFNAQPALEKIIRLRFSSGGYCQPGPIGIARKLMEGFPVLQSMSRQREG